MKITAIRATPVNIPLRAPYRFSYGSIASLTKTVVQVETDQGVTGLGGPCSTGQWNYIPCANSTHSNFGQKPSF